MTIKYYRGIERDGLVFLVDKEGKELLDSRTGESLLAALPVDVSAALVKVPDRKPESRDYYNCNDEWNACLDELEGK